jgi:hypothetical protein
VAADECIRINKKELKIMNTQVELRELYHNILETERWHGDKKMVDYCMSQAAYIVKLTSGDITIIDKPRIEKHFCFGYSLNRHDKQSKE